MLDQSDTAVAFTFTIKSDNAAFGESAEDAREELKRILEFAIKQVDILPTDGTPSSLRDVNGNKIGLIKLNLGGRE